MDRTFKIVYDFDTQLYTSCVILEDSYIVVEHLDSGRKKEFNSVTEFQGRGRKEAGGWLAELNKEKGTSFNQKDFKIEHKKRRNRVPFRKAQEAIHLAVGSIMGQSFYDPDKGLKLVISGSNNYRHTIDPNYKANRPEKPLMYQELRDWFLNIYHDKIIVADGAEADDVCNIYGYQDYIQAKQANDVNKLNVVIACIDKDLLQTPGFKFDFRKKTKPYFITERQAFKNLCVQLLEGDASDNISGLEGVTLHSWGSFGLTGRRGLIGNKNAKKALSDCESMEAMKRRVEYLYQDYYCDMWKDELKKQYQLLCLMKEPNKIPEYEFITDGDNQC